MSLFGTYGYKKGNMAINTFVIIAWGSGSQTVLRATPAFHLPYWFYVSPIPFS